MHGGAVLAGPAVVPSPSGTPGAASATPNAPGSASPKLSVGSVRGTPSTAVPRPTLSASGAAGTGGGRSGDTVLHYFVLAVILAAVLLAAGIAGLLLTRRGRPAAAGGPGHVGPGRVGPDPAPRRRRHSR